MHRHSSRSDAQDVDVMVRPAESHYRSPRIGTADRPSFVDAVLVKMTVENILHAVHPEKSKECPLAPEFQRLPLDHPPQVSDRP